MMISVAIPNFNSGDRIVKNFPKLFDLLRKSKFDFEVLVIDDCSTDDSVFKLENYLEFEDWSLRILKKSSNTGFGMTVDRGVREAKGEIVFVLNVNDILPEKPEFFKLMLEHFKDPKVFSVAAKKREAKDHGCGEIYFEMGFFLHRRADKIGKFSAWADGGAQALRKEYYLKIGGFDPLYKFYWEDVDLGYRAWKAGYEVHFESKAILLHQKKEGPIAKYYNGRQRRIMNLRNQFIFTWKNSDLKRFFLAFLWLPYYLSIALKNGDWDFLMAYLQAKRQFLKILTARFRQKKVTKLSEDQVLHVFQ